MTRPTTAVVGAAGAVGRAAVAALVADDRRDVVAVDRDAAAAAALPSVGRSRGVDVLDADALDAVLADVDEVIGCAGPFHLLGTAVLDAAIRTSTTFVDVADDPAPTLASLDRHEDATAAGVTAVVGAGASPGLTDALAMTAARELDEVHQVVTLWPEDPVADLVDVGAEPSAATSHWIHQLVNRVPALRGGQVVDVDALEHLDLDVPGVGRVDAWSVGHPEAVTLRPALPGLRASTNAMVMRRSDAEVLVDVVTEIRADGLTDDEGAHRLRERFARVVDADRSPAPALDTLAAVVLGRRGGRTASAAALLRRRPATDGIGPITALPAVAALDVLAADPRPGVRPPSTGLDADHWFAAYARLIAVDPSTVASVAVS